MQKDQNQTKLSKHKRTCRDEYKNWYGHLEKTFWLYFNQQNSSGLSLQKPNNLVAHWCSNWEDNVNTENLGAIILLRKVIVRHIAQTFVSNK